ncbi:MAG: geranylgeranylglyceryl/heptaprenylglyceryl phosphate synthase [Bacteroidota bacterium]|nr:geranylgeranylglyceryl/heptaprenylglyceryl phosphate synthase [Bacteroidota bacterium]
MKGGKAVYESLLSACREDGALLFVLLDPDRFMGNAVGGFVRAAEHAGVDGFLVGGSLSAVTDMTQVVAEVKSATTRPVILFPGGVHHVTGAADAMLLLSVLSGRNPEFLIGQHVVAAPIIRRLGVECISTAYLLVESGRTTAAEFMSATKPLPRHKPELAAAHAMAAELLGFRCVYLEAGSGADEPVPDSLVEAVARKIEIPIIVGGGIRSPETAASKVRAGASVVVVGNYFEEKGHEGDLQAFSDAVHGTQRGKPRNDPLSSHTAER